MISLHRSCFLNTNISGLSSLFSYKLKKLPPASVKATALGPNKDRNGSILIENNNTLKEIRDGSSSVADVDSNPTVASKDRDVCYDAVAAEDQVVTPRAISVASGCSLL